MIRRPPRSTRVRSSAASDVYKRQSLNCQLATSNYSMRTPFVAANWKMYKTVAETVAYLRDFGTLVSAVDDVEIVVAPPFVGVHAAAEAVRGTRVGIAGQDLYWEREGAF